MAKKKLLADILGNPARFYRVPGDVLRDRRFEDAERREILTAWERTGGEQSEAIALALVELNGRDLNHAAE